MSTLTSEDQPTFEDFTRAICSILTICLNCGFGYTIGYVFYKVGAGLAGNFLGIVAIIPGFIVGFLLVYMLGRLISRSTVKFLITREMRAFYLNLPKDTYN